MDFGKLLEESGAVLHGHFLLTSGRHSDVYFEKFRVLEQPDVLSALCAEIAEINQDKGFELVVGPTTGGIIIAFEVARQMGLPAMYAETEDGHKRFRRGATMVEGAKVLIVDDVLTTGTSIREVMRAVTDAGGVPSGISVLIDRSRPELEFGIPLTRAYAVEAHSYDSSEIPDWLAAIPVTQPGTRVFAPTNV